jgi:outer membrane protein OmpA-like peptidoglycan-associated protein
MKNLLCFAVTCIFLFPACAPLETKTQKGGTYGAAGGAAAGAVLGQAIGHDTEATLWGAAIGAALGGVTGAGAGKMMDNQERDMRQALAASEAASVRREGNLLAIVLKGDLTFATDSTVVKPGLHSELDRIAGVIMEYPQTMIRIEGHTDSTGSETYNQDLSERRAGNVRNLLAQRGVSYNRMQVIGYGESMPVASNDTEAGRQMNRRVEIKLAPEINRQ